MEGEWEEGSEGERDSMCEIVWELAEHRETNLGGDSESEVDIERVYVCVS